MKVNGRAVDLHVLLSAVTFLVVIFGAGGVWYTMADDVKDHEERIGEVEKKAAKIDAHGRQLEAQADGINWIGQAIEEIADKQDIRLPPRPIVPSEAR